MDIVSTKGVAEMLGVSEATVKRWADAGTLRCFRTAGGHRKFRIRDVKAFLSDMTDGAPADVTPPPATDLDAEQKEARRLALAGDVDALVSFVATQRLRGRSLANVFDAVFRPLMFDLGEGQARGTLSIAQVHVASGSLVETLARVRPLVERASAGKGRAVCACLGDEQHDIGVRMVSLVLAADGYRITLVGARTPAGDVAMMIAADPPEIVALSASAHAEPGPLRADLDVVAGAVASRPTRIIVGGVGFAKLAALPDGVRRYTNLEELVAVAST